MSVDAPQPLRPSGHHRRIRDSGEIIIWADATSQPSTSARVSNRHIPFNDLRRFAFKII
jgi:hypothetical protein